MTNYERLLDLPLREVLKEFKVTDCETVSDAFSYFLNCHQNHAACADCEHVFGGCLTVCKHWFELEAKPDANYSREVWHNALEEDPPTSDTTLEYLVFIHGVDIPCVLIFDGENWLDDNGNHYHIDWWRPLPERPQVSE